jgi:hypothetical protein
MKNPVVREVIVTAIQYLIICSIFTWIGYSAGIKQSIREANDIRQAIHEEAKAEFLKAVAFSISSGMLTVNHDKVNELCNKPYPTNETNEVEMIDTNIVDTIEYPESGNEEG